MKNILCIEPSGKLYGSEMVLLDILKNKKDLNFSYKVILPPNSPFLSRLRENGIRYLDNLNITGNVVHKIISYLNLFFYLCTKKVDLIFVNQAGIIRPIAIIANLKNIPIVCEVSTLEDAHWVNDLSPKYFKNVYSFICNSNFISSELKVPQDKKSILYYGYEWKSLNPVARTEADPFKIVLLGRLSRSKGHFLLVEAVKQLLDKYPVNLEVSFVGDALDVEVERELKNEINKYNLNRTFIFRGFHKEIVGELADKNLMVIPSLNEPFGRIFCEAAEAKIPVIVANSGGLGELSKHFNLGISFDGNNATDLAVKLHYAISNYEVVKSEFNLNSQLMLHKLDMSSYITMIESIMSRAMQRQPTSINWFGQN